MTGKADMNNLILPYLEWEMLREPITISKVNDGPELPKGEKKITVSRDEDYNLRATLHFKDPDFGRTLLQQPVVAGDFAEGFNIQGSSSESLLYTLESCEIGEIRLGRMPDDKEAFDTSEIILHGLKTRYGNENEGAHLTDWYVNGPRDFVFRRATDRKVSGKFLRERFASKEDKIDSTEVIRKATRSVSLDFIRIKSHDLEFLISKVPNGIGPVWSSNIGIEYRKTWGRIPDLPEREKIEELCSFIFGRQLLPVGYTIYDQDENLVEGYAVDPWGNATRALCSKPNDRPPIRISNSARGKAEDLISQLLPIYYEKRDSLRLKEALWNYWISRNMPAGTNLPILAAAVESVIRGWFKSTGSKSQGEYMKKEDFEALLQEETEDITRKLKEKLEEKSGDQACAHANAIIAKIQEAHRFGWTEEYRKFFEEIALPVEKCEWEAIEERSKFVHGHRLFDKTDWRRVIQHADTFETLLHKVLLKMLGYSGTFIDRSTLGWKDKQLS